VGAWVECGEDAVEEDGVEQTYRDINSLTGFKTVYDSTFDHILDA